MALGPLDAQPRAQISRTLRGSLPPQARLGGCGGVVSETSRAFPAGALEGTGTGRSRGPAFLRGGPALPDLLLPLGSAPPDLAVAETCGASQPRGGELRHLGQSFRVCCHLPLPQPPLGMFILPSAPCSFLFHFSFRWGLGLPGFRAPGGTPADWLFAVEAHLRGREPGGSACPAAPLAAPSPAARTRWR